MTEDTPIHIIKKSSLSSKSTLSPARQCMFLNPTAGTKIPQHMGWSCSNPGARGHTGYVCKCRSSLMPRPLPSVWSRLLLRSVPEAIRAGPGAAGSRGSRPRGSCLGAAPRTRRALGRARGGRSASYSGSVSQGGPGSRQPCQGARQPPRDAASQGELRGQPAASQVSGRRLCPARRTVQDGRSEPTV